MQKIFTTTNSKETRKLGAMLAKELHGGEIICLSGELGAGKTTFTQGFLEELGAEKPYTSPTFVVMKEYELKKVKSRKTLEIEKIYHFDAYRIEEVDFLNLGWEEILVDEKNVSIMEWADKIKKVIPARAIWINFEWKSEKKRKITLVEQKEALGRLTCQNPKAMLKRIDK